MLLNNNTSTERLVHKIANLSNNNNGRYDLPSSVKITPTTDTSIFCNGFYPYGWVIDSSELSPYKLKLFSGNMFQIIQLSEFYCSM